MKICGMEKFSLVDYDGHVACTIFLAGCNFKCPFCHNASLAYGGSGDIEIPVSDVINYLDKRKGVIDAVCISGGEPTLSKDLESLILIFKAKGLKIKLDSNGSNPEILEYFINEGLIDYVAMDIKNSFTNYSPITGGYTNIDNIKRSINILMNSNIGYEFRTTLVKEYHTKEDIKEIGKMIKGADKYFLQKFVDNDNCIKHDLHAIEKEEADEFIEILKEYVPSVKLRGY